MAKVKDLAIVMHEYQITMAKEKGKLRYNVKKIKELRKKLDVALDNCDSSVESNGYINDNEMDFLKSTNRDLVEVSFNRNDNIKKIRVAHDAIQDIKNSLKDGKNVK